MGTCRNGGWPSSSWGFARHCRRGARRTGALAGMRVVVDYRFLESARPGHRLPGPTGTTAAQIVRPGWRPGGGQGRCPLPTGFVTGVGQRRDRHPARGADQPEGGAGQPLACTSWRAAAVMPDGGGAVQPSAQIVSPSPPQPARRRPPRSHSIKVTATGIDADAPAEPDRDPGPGSTPPRPENPGLHTAETAVPTADRPIITRLLCVKGSRCSFRVSLRNG